MNIVDRYTIHTVRNIFQSTTSYPPYETKFTSQTIDNMYDKMVNIRLIYQIVLDEVFDE